jgi:hypothetical protein
VDTGPTPFEQRGFRSCPATNVLTADEDPSRLGEAQTYFQEGDEPPAPAFTNRYHAGSPTGRSGAPGHACHRNNDVHRRRGQTPDGTEATVTFTERPVPTLGDEAVGQSARFDFADRPDATIDVMAVRLDDVIVLTIGERHDANAQASLSTARLEELTRKAVQKVQRNIPSS